jgi:tyrosine-protein kinase Etk/Wzc
MTDRAIDLRADTVDLANVGRTLRRGWRIVTVTVLASLAAGTVVLVYAPPKFTGEASIVLRSGGEGGASVLSKLTGLGDAGAGLLGGAMKSPLETEIQVLNSRSLVGHVVDSLGLQRRLRSPRGVAVDSVIPSVQLLGAFQPQSYSFERQPDGTFRVTGRDTSFTAKAGADVALPVGRIQLATSSALPSSFEIELRDREDAITRLKKYLTIDKAGGEVASVVYRGDDSVSAAAVPNALIAEYMMRRRTTDRGVNQRRVEMLTAKIDSVNQRLSDAERALRREREASGVFDPIVNGRLQLERSGDLRTRLTELAVEQSALSLLLSQVGGGSMSARQLAAYPTFLRSPAINDLISQLAQVETRRYTLLGTRTEQDPEVQALGESAQNIERQLLPLARTYAASVNKEHGDLTRVLDTLRSTIAVLPQSAEANTRLQREVLQLGEIYGAMQGQLVDARLAAIGEGGQIQPLDLAATPKRPSFPKPLPTLGVSLAGGLFSGLLIALLVGALGRWLQDPESVERASGIPTLRFDPRAPLLLAGATPRTILVAAVDRATNIDAVVQRLAETASSRSVSATVLDLTGGPMRDVDKTITRLEGENGLVILKLPSVSSDVAASVMRPDRPVLLVTPERRVGRTQLLDAVQMLRRLDTPCAGVVMSGSDTNGVRA